MARDCHVAAMEARRSSRADSRRDASTWAASLLMLARPESPSAASASARWRAARRLTKRLDTPMHKSSPQVHRMKFSPAGEVMALMPST